MLALLAFIAGICLFHGFASLVSAALEHRVENLTEWWGSVALTLIFLIIASLWRRWGLVVTIGLQRAGRAEVGASSFARPISSLPLAQRAGATLPND